MATLSTSDLRKPVVIASALSEFARGGFHGTTIAAVGRAAGISPAYVFKLFPSKEQLFVAALDDCFRQCLETFEAAAARASDRSPDGILDEMGAAYADLIVDRSLIMIQVHAQSVADVPEIGASYRGGMASITRLVQSLSGADDESVQRMVAYGQLCHLIVVAGLIELDEDWAKVISHGFRHG
jgi:AcrR family transcriptional regulator